MHAFVLLMGRAISRCPYFAFRFDSYQTAKALLFMLSISHGKRIGLERLVRLGHVLFTLACINWLHSFKVAVPAACLSVCGTANSSCWIVFGSPCPQVRTTSSLGNFFEPTRWLVCVFSCNIWPRCEKFWVNCLIFVQSQLEKFVSLLLPPLQQ